MDHTKSKAELQTTIFNLQTHEQVSPIFGEIMKVIAID
jgi:hypothetical protein